VTCRISATRKIAGYDRRRGKPGTPTSEQKARHNVVARRGQKVANERTRELADQHGQSWSGGDDQYVVEHPELTNAAIAYALGRTAQAAAQARADP